MPHDVYSLPDLIDLALKVPEVGAVNFNILHTILQAIVKELKLTDVRPFCQVDNSFLIKASHVKEKLKEVQLKKAASEEYIFEEPRHSIIDDKAVVKGRKESVRFESKKESAQASTEETGESETLKRKDSVKQTEDAEFTQDEHEKDAGSQDVESGPTETKEVTKSQDTPTETEEVTESQETETKKVTITEPTQEDKKASQSQDTETKTEKMKLEDLIIPKRTPTPPQRTFGDDDDDHNHYRKKSHKGHVAQDSWKYISLSNRTDAVEEGLDRLGNIVDIIATKMQKTEQRRKEGGPASEELESIDDRLLEVETVFEQIADDHTMLLDINERSEAIMQDITKIKGLAELIEQMQIDISKKADKEETWAALATKGDLEMLKQKIDRVEFETAIEELGEAIGLLGLKFMRKHEEWEERAAEIWKAIDSKMTFDVFEAARIKTESRLTALMYGLSKLKKVVEDLLYPEASGVTRCILCRRPACISGLECLECVGIFTSPKRPLSARSSAENGDPEKLKKSSYDAIHKKPKMDVPPYCQSPDTIISKPYSSASSRSSAGGKESTDRVQMKLKPVSSRRGSGHSSKSSEIPKLPDIDARKSSSRSDNKSVSVMKSRTKSHGKTPELYFTKKMLAKMESKTSSKDQKYRFTAVLEVEPTKTVKIKTSSKSSATSVDLTPDPTKTMDEFAPARLMPDTLRRNILLSPTSPKDKKSNMTLSPLQFDT